MGDSGMAINIETLRYADIDGCARMTAAAFSTDRHTIVKQLGDKPFDMFKLSRDGFEASLHKKTCIYVKAVDQAGNIVGHAGWGFRGIEKERIPWRRPDDEASTPQERTGSFTEGIKDKEKLQCATAKEKKATGHLDRLRALEDADLVSTMSKLMPSGTSCMYIIGLIVVPQYQSRGVGSALIEHGNAIADHFNVFTWVHSSDQAWRAYGKLGFEIFKKLDLDLDEYAPSQPGKEWARKLEGTGEGVTEERWGRYVIRYMKRGPRIQGE